MDRMISSMLQSSSIRTAQNAARCGLRAMPAATTTKRRHLTSEALRYNNSNTNSGHNTDGPTGSLFATTDNNRPVIGPDLVGATASIRRTFGPRSNAEGLLATGGAELAAHASFDPDYSRAQDWIRHHAVGPAVLSPILIAGLTGALTEAAFPHAVIKSQSMRHIRLLIVGVPITSMIEVIAVEEEEESTERSNSNDNNENNERNKKCDRFGYNVTLKTKVTRVRDNDLIAEGIHELWVPDYLRM